MPTADFFARLGVFVIRGFLDPQLCKELRKATRSANLRRATILTEGDVVLNDGFRKTFRAEAPASAETVVRARLKGIKGLIQSHFQLELTGFEKPQFLLYENTDFYQPHQDSRARKEGPEYLRLRKVSVVMFLNGESELPRDDCYCGGSLTLYNLVEDSRWEGYGFPLRGEEGLLVAFRSDTFHEVTRISYGQRYTIVTWFF